MKTETAIGAAMKRAGFDAAETQLRGIVIDALKKHHNNLDRAMKTIERDVDGDVDMVRVALRFFAQNLLPDVGRFEVEIPSQTANGRQTPNGDGGHVLIDRHLSDAASLSRNGDGLSPGAYHKDAAIPVREPSQAQLAADLAVKARSALTVFDRELTRTGQRWGNVCYSELSNMTEDGDVARAIRMHIGSLRGAEALKPIRELMTPREFAILFNRVTKGSK